MRILLSAVVAVALLFTGVHAQESRSAQIQALLKARVDALSLIHI